ncbi:glycosyltransferase family 39 protein [Micromonospora sp. WMMD1102]|uniref:ArnT family glycosyltransferase n=1 Tax=Micromonospora sp. WMMD1102 TaxID=3016105 RepID=UPI00241500BE|nr:glycosyltransferase family 39 protein [Micromonospora sp. WMMD1102]MDG4788218.1 glycosyltransferase family 39 protein [Micromonospora sp. WMMD1102]
MTRTAGPPIDPPRPAATEVLPRISGPGPAARPETGRQSRRGHQSRRGRPRRRPHPDVALLGALLGVVLTVQAWNIGGFPIVTDDEGTYLAQAWAVREGLALAHYTYWYDHPPLGWIQLAGLSWLPALLMPDQLAVVTGRVAMLPVTGTSLVLVYLLCRRLGLARWTGAVAVLGYGLSPLAVTMQRQIYLDSFAVAWMLGAFVLALSPRRHLWHHVAAGAAAGAAVLSKETIVIVLPALVVALWRGTAPGGVRPFSFAGFGTGLLTVGIGYPLYALLKRELLPGPGHVSLLGALRFQLQGREGSGSLFAAGSSAREVLDAWLFYDPVLIYAGIVAGLLCLAVRRLRPVAVAVTLLLAVALRPDGYLPAMYVVQALPFLAVAVAGLAETGARRLLGWRDRAGRTERSLRVAVVVAAVAVALAVVAPRWYEGNLRAVTAEDNGRYAAALAWLRTEVPERSDRTIVTDDVLWLDLLDAGYRRDRVIWFYKLDLDREVAERLTDGWREVDLIVSTPPMRADDNPLPTVDLLLANSAPLVTFGTGSDRIEIRQVRRD